MALPEKDPKAQEPIDNAAEAAPASVIDRVADAIEKEGFNPSAIKGIDFLPLFVRYEEWLGRPMTPGEASDYINCLVAVRDGDQNLEDIAKGETLLVPTKDGMLTIFADPERFDSVRKAFDAADGDLHIGAFIPDPLLFSLDVDLGEGYGLRVRARSDEGAPYGIMIGKERKGSFHTGCLDVSGILTEVFNEGRRQGGWTDICAEDTDPVVAAILALKPGEAWSEMLVDARPYQADGSAGLSIRAYVERQMDGGYRGNIDMLDGTEKAIWYEAGGDEGFPEKVSFDNVEEVVAALAYYRLHGRGWERQLAKDAPIGDEGTKKVAA